MKGRVNEAKLYKKREGGGVECVACSWYCKIGLGGVGVCGTRYNRNGRLFSLVYGRPTGLAVDPVEKKPLFHFLPGISLLSFGTVGCNFGCEFCQNWEMSQLTRTQKSKVPADGGAGPSTIRYGAGKSQNLEKELVGLVEQVSVRMMPAEIVETAVRRGVEGIAYTYNEPAIFVEFAHDTAKLAKKRGLKNVWVSNGFESKETFNYVREYLDGINIDLKSWRSEFYQNLCKAKIAPVLENIKRFFEAGIEMEVTTLVIPGHNDGEEELKNIGGFLAGISKDIPWHISAFYPAYKMMGVSPTPLATLERAYEIGKKAGLKFIYVGNVMDERRSSTYCPACEELLIWRRGYEVEIRNFRKEGRCGNCGEKIYGRWS